MCSSWSGAARPPSSLRPRSRVLESSVWVEAHHPGYPQVSAGWAAAVQGRPASGWHQDIGRVWFHQPNGTASGPSDCGASLQGRRGIWRRVHRALLQPTRAARCNEATGLRKQSQWTSCAVRPPPQLSHFPTKRDLGVLKKNYPGLGHIVFQGRSPLPGKVIKFSLSISPKTEILFGTGVQGSWTFSNNGSCWKFALRNMSRTYHLGLPWWSSGYECRGQGLHLWSRKMPRALWQLSPCATTT